jgi:hypothetical protein
MPYFNPDEEQQQSSPLYEALMTPMQKSWQFFSKPSEYAQEQLDINQPNQDQTQFDRMKWLRKLEQMGGY